MASVWYGMTVLRGIGSALRAGLLAAQWSCNGSCNGVAVRPALVWEPYARYSNIHHAAQSARQSLMLGKSDAVCSLADRQMALLSARV